tara:strand:+ start:99 stop:635 length:537 start_codon:yes stop_codon:yes gene_type:complete
MFEKIGILPFQTKHYIDTIDWASVSKGRNRLFADWVGGHKTIKVQDLNNSFGKNIKDYCEKDLNLKIYQVNITMAPPGSLTPMHTDEKSIFRNNLNIEKKHHDKIFLKYWIPLSDKTIGHWFEYNGVLIENWKANEVYRLFGSSTFEHCGGNMGVENRIRLEITGSQLSANKIHQIFA